jgi:hypothetical protein
MAESKTSVCNMSLARFGAIRINDFDDASEAGTSIIYCRLFFYQTAKALMRSHWWRFARHRVQLSQDPNTPDFQWNYAYHLPSDFLRHILIYDGSDMPQGRTYVSYELEGQRLLIDESEVYMKYIRWIEDVGAWDPLFIEVMVLQLAQKLCIPLTQDAKIKADIDDDLGPLMRKVRAMDRNEAEQVGRDELKTWNDARYSDTG